VATLLLLLLLTAFLAALGRSATHGASGYPGGPGPFATSRPTSSAAYASWLTSVSASPNGPLRRSSDTPPESLTGHLTCGLTWSG
jgi:hypothetical protein